MLLNSGFVNINGMRFYYETLGDGPPLVLIHGGLMDCRMWDDQFTVLAQNYHVIRYDLRGHGKSERPPGTFSHYRDLHGLLNYLQIETAVLIGQSLGGRAAISYTLEHPERVRALVLVAAGVEGCTFSSETLQAFSDMAAARKRGDNNLAADIFMQRWIVGRNRTTKDVNPVVQKRVRAMIDGNYARPSVTNVQPMEEPKALERLPEIRVPTLIMIGDCDETDIAEMADRLYEEIPNAQKTVLPGGHLVNMEQPEAFNKCVLEFLNKSTK